MTQGESPSPGSADLADLSLRGRGGKGHIIIIGASARAAAQSAIRAGYSPWCIDLFADRDLQAIAPVKRCPREKWPEGILELMHDAPPGPVLFTGAMEKHALVTAAICRTRPILGCGVPAIGLFHMSPYLRKACGAARSLLSRDLELDGPIERPGVVFAYRMSRVAWWFWRRWQRLAGRVFVDLSRAQRQLWNPRTSKSRPQIVMPFIEGTPVSAVFTSHTDGECMLGLTEQLIGDANFGAPAFSYAGNIGPLPGCDRIRRQFAALGQELSDMGITGIFGIDGVAGNRKGKSTTLAVATRLTFMECNPRYTASVELYEKALGVSALHVELPPVSLTPKTILGKAVVYAKSLVIVPDLLQSIDPKRIADVPQKGERIDPGHPICTVYADGDTRDACYVGLREMAEQIYTRLEPA